MSLSHRRAWLIVLVVTMVTAAVVAPRAADAGPQSFTAEAPTEVPLQVGALTVPAGWTVDIPAAAGSVLVATKDGVEVVAFDALWLGSSESLLERAAELVADGEAELPPFEDHARESCLTGPGVREHYTVTIPEAGDDSPRRVDVVRVECTALVLHTTGSQAAVDAVAGDLADIIDSAWLPEAGLGALEEGQS